VHSLPLPGDLVWIRQRRWRIERVRRSRNVVRLDVANRDARLTFLAPFDRPAAVPRSEKLRHVRPQHAVARLAGLAGAAHGWRSLSTAVHADIDVLPYQLEPALAIASGARRVLIADEVGLGKTIQAGLIVSECLRRSPAARVLVVVPPSLAQQWAGELSGRFRITCVVSDARRLEVLGRAGAPDENPWTRSGVWMASIDFLKQTHVLDAMPWRPWDLVVVDEAHAACGDSDRHLASQQILRRSRCCVLLTATPHSGEAARFERLLNLGHSRYDTLTIFRRTRASLGLPGQRRVRWRGIALSEAERRVLDALMTFEAALLRAAGSACRDPALLLLSVFRKRALSTMTALARTIDRRLVWLGAMEDDELEWVQPGLDFGQEADDVTGDERAALTGRTGMQGAHERAWLRRVRGLVDIAARNERKIAHIAAALGRSPEPAIVFTEFRDSLEAIERRLSRVRSVATIHGGQSPQERGRQLERFLDGGASVLLATDVAGQGLNLQARARWVISLELPWNPARLEQRIGRVDRIGQARSVHATLLVARHEAEAGLLARLARRTLTARQSVGEGLLDSVTPDASAVARTLIEQVPFDISAAPARVPICRTFRRSAAAVARRLDRGRALARLWRGPLSADARTGWTYRHRLNGLRRVAGGSVLVFSVPILDRTGIVIERHVVAVSVAGLDRRTAGFEQIVDRARAEATRTLEKRVRRLQQVVHSRLAREAAFDRVLAEEIRDEWIPAEAQPGLFDRRELAAFEAARREGLVLEAALDDEVVSRREQAVIEVGRPALELAFLAK
jgi:superfamily II DNA or RNA helicase